MLVWLFDDETPAVEAGDGGTSTDAFLSIPEPHSMNSVEREKNSCSINRERELGFESFHINRERNLGFATRNDREW